jgi:hypothetical protein
MAKKQFFLIIDTETTIEDTVYDFGAVVCDRQGNIHHECAVIVAEEMGKELFYDKSSKDEIWTLKGLERRKANYRLMLDNGQRMAASRNAVNRWLEKVAAKYNPELTAYNLAFDLAKLQNTGIDVSMFQNRFCLWHMAAGNFAHTKEYRKFILQNHLFNPPTDKGNMSYKTNAEVMASFLNGEMLPPEPHTALEDAKFYELPILTALLKKRNFREKAKPYNWKDYQVKNNFSA